MSRKARRQANARMTALTWLSEVLDHGASLADLQSPGLDARDAGFAAHLAYGVLRWLSALEWIASQLLQKPLKNKDRDIQRLVLLGLHQLWKGDTPAHAAIHETAECARLRNKPWAVGLVNAVLRRFVREQDSLLQSLAQNDARHAHPQWLLERLKKDWPGTDSPGWQDIVHAGNLAAPLWLRIHARADREAVMTALDEGFSCQQHPLLTEAVALSPAAPVEKIPGFKEGLLSVQDPAPQLAANLLDVTEGQRVLDACSAPGGKTSHLLERTPDLDLWALDRSKPRLDRVKESLARLRLDKRNVTLLCADAGDTGSWWDGQPFQRILLDAPCTATGVIRRHPEIKWLRTPSQLEEASRVQASLLKSLWPLLDSGGMLLYATCSIIRQENDRQMQQFLEDQADAELAPINPGVGHDTGHGWQIFPGEQDMDGFFYALLRKKH